MHAVFQVYSLIITYQSLKISKDLQVYMYRHNVRTLSVLHGYFQILFRYFQIMQLLSLHVQLNSKLYN